MLEAFLVPMLWVIGFGLGLIVVGTLAFLEYCWIRSLVDGDGEPDGDDGES